VCGVGFVYMAEGGEERARLLVEEGSGVAEFDVTRDSHKERDAVDKHDISTEGDMMVTELWYSAVAKYIS
jgi:hypothetical protein